MWWQLAGHLSWRAGPRSGPDPGVISWWGVCDGDCYLVVGAMGTQNPSFLGVITHFLGGLKPLFFMVLRWLLIWMFPENSGSLKTPKNKSIKTYGFFSIIIFTIHFWGFPTIFGNTHLVGGWLNHQPIPEKYCMRQSVKFCQFNLPPNFGVNIKSVWVATTQL